MFLPACALEIDCFNSWLVPSRWQGDLSHKVLYILYVWIFNRKSMLNSWWQQLEYKWDYIYTSVEWHHDLPKYNLLTNIGLFFFIQFENQTAYAWKRLNQWPWGAQRFDQWFIAKDCWTLMNPNAKFIFKIFEKNYIKSLLNILQIHNVSSYFFLFN